MITSRRMGAHYIDYVTRTALPRRRRHRGGRWLTGALVLAACAALVLLAAMRP